MVKQQFLKKARRKSKKKNRTIWLPHFRILIKGCPTFTLSHDVFFLWENDGNGPMRVAASKTFLEEAFLILLTKSCSSFDRFGSLYLKKHSRIKVLVLVKKLRGNIEMIYYKTKCKSIVFSVICSSALELELLYKLIVLPSQIQRNFRMNLRTRSLRFLHIFKNKLLEVPNKFWNMNNPYEIVFTYRMSK